MSAGVEYTIDELAREAGTTVRSVRVYHERGVLPPPQVKGRTGFYGPEHLNRVRTISRLLDRGIKINGIRELLNAWDRGDDLGAILGVGEPTPSGTSATGTIAATELAERFSDIPDGLARVVAAGLYEPVDATTYRVVDANFSRILDQLSALGISHTDLLDELDRLRADSDRMARSFVELFRQTAWHTYQQSEQSPADAAELTERLTEIKRAAGQITTELVVRSVARYLDSDSELAEALSTRDLLK
ncbi:MerR family transcriptional regulator [Nocardia iowensis]|uniref:MerR family transcriptional regulator n=2 Tax=Nocardia iowensis TaxID=204891 RepID=A0ABX8S112_NOCIO|nr:MerR family transcriptional regulator [Nocardia iowensis]